MLKEMSARLRELTPEKIQEIMLLAMRRNDRQIVKMNTDQLLQGVDSKDHFLEPYHSDSYANYKQTLNPLGVTDLRLTGAFHEGFFLSANNFPAYIFSTDEKTRKLVGKYGFDVFGLDEENLETTRKSIVEPAIVAAIKQAIHV